MSKAGAAVTLVDYVGKGGGFFEGKNRLFFIRVFFFCKYMDCKWRGTTNRIVWIFAVIYM